MEILENQQDLVHYLIHTDILYWRRLVERCSEKRLLRRDKDLTFHVWFAGLLESVNEGWLVDQSQLATENGIISWSKMHLNSFTRRNQMVSYASSVTMQYLGVDFPKMCKCRVRSSDEEQVVMQHFATAIGRVVGLLPRKFGQWVMEGAINAITSVFDKVKALFFRVLGSYAPMINQWCSWVNSFWDQLKVQAQEMYNNAVGALRGLEEAFYWGLAIIGTVSLVACIERFLFTVGLISSPIGFVKMLIPAFIAAFCLTNTMSFIGAKFEQINELLGFFFSQVVVRIPAQMFPDFFSHDSEGSNPNMQFSPISILESFAGALTNISGQSIVEAGRVAGAFNSIKTAGSNAQTLVNTVLAGLWHVVDGVFGIKSQALATLSISLGCDIELWLKECDAVEEFFLRFGRIDAGLLKNVRKLMGRGRRIQSVIMQEGRNVSPAVSSVVMKALERLQLTHKQMVLRGQAGPRKMPFVVALAGPSRSGKSLLARKIAEELCDLEGMDGDQIYVRQGTDPFWSGYRRQFITMYDDFAAVPNSNCRSDEIELIPLVSTAPVALNMAAVEEKGNIFFESEAIVYSTNFMDASPNSEVQDFQAFRNRRHVLVRVERSDDPERVYNGGNAIHCQKYTIHRNDEVFTRMAAFDNYEDLWVYIQNKWHDHTVEQEADLAALRGNRSVMQQPLRSMLDLVRSTNVMLPSDLEAVLKSRNAYYVTNIGTKVYAIGADGVYFDLEYSGRGELPVYGGMEQSIAMVEALHSTATINPLATFYLDVLVRRRWLRDDLTWEVCASELDEYIRENVTTMTDTHKALLVCLQYHYAQRDGGKWYQALWRMITQTMATAFYEDVSKWPLPLKIFVGGVLVVAIGATFWAAMGVLCNLSKSAGFGTAGAAVFTASMQSRAPNRNEFSEFRLRNVPAKARRAGKVAWADDDGEMDFSIPPFQNTLNSENFFLMTKFHALLEIAGLQYQVMMIPGKRMLLCEHFVRQWKHMPMRFSVRINLSSGRSFVHMFNKERVTFLEGSELALYENPTLEDVAHSLWKHMCFDVEAECGATVRGVMMSFRPSNHTGELEFTHAPLNIEVVKHSVDLAGADYVRQIPRALQYKVPTENQDCGSLIMARIGSEWKVVGVHVAGKTNLGFANLLPVIEKPTGSTIFSATMQHEMDHYFELFEEENVVGASLSCVGSCKNTAYVRVPKKTSLVPTPKEWHLGTEVVKEPSVLTSDDQRLGVHSGIYDPFSTGLQKYSQTMHDLDQNLLDEAIDEMGCEWFDCIDDEDDFREVSTSVALNGVAGMEYFDSLILGTSEGFPHCLERKGGDKGKSRFVEGEIGNLRLREGTSVARALDYLENEVIDHAVPTLFGIECPKDELLPLRKIYDKPKTRLFTVLPMEYNILIRKQYLGFVRFVMRHRNKLACKVGTNPYSREWDGIANSLLNTGNKILCCDYSSFDGLCSKQMMDAILQVIQRVTGDSGQCWERKKNTLMAACSRYAIAQARIWRVEGGIPSGIPLTVILNSMMNELLIRYFYKLRFKNDALLRASFKNFISLATYGDDNLISVHSSISEVFDGKFLKEAMARKGITITDGVDKTLPTLHFRQLEDCDFLKRGFKMGTDGIFVGPLEKSSLWGQLHYVREGGADMIEAFITNAENVCRELFLHSPLEAAQFRNKILKLGLFPAKMFPSMAQVEAFFQEQRGHKNQNFNLSVDIMLNPELLGSLTPINEKGAGLPHSIIPNVDFANYSMYQRRDGDFLVLCGALGDSNEDQLQIKFPYGQGRGGLPTSIWLEKNFNSKGANMRKIIATQYHNGRRIVFLSPTGNVVAMVFAVMFAYHSKLIDKSISNATLSLAIEKCQVLRYLQRDLPDLFF